MTDRPLVERPAVAGGLDLDVPGRDVRLRGTRWPGTGVPVLLLHGLASTRHIWDLVVPHLAGLPVLALDQRGHGDSERPQGPYDSATVVADALTALDALGLSRVVVVGHSWGGTTALRLAASAPERVLAVVSVDGPLGGMAGIAASREQVRRRLEPPRTALTPDDLRALVSAGPLAPWWSEQVEAAVLPVFGLGADGLARARLPFEAHMQIVDDLIDRDVQAVLPDVRCPAWLVQCSSLPGRDDRADDRADDWAAVREAAFDTAGRVLPAPRLLRWAGAVHDVPLQWPALVAGVVRAATEEVATAAGGAGTGA